MNENNQKNKPKYLIIDDFGAHKKLIFQGELTLTNAKDIEKEFNYEKILVNTNSIECDFTNIQRYDSFIVVLMENLFDYCNQKKINFNIIGMSDNLSAFSALLKPKATTLKKKQEHSFFNYIEVIGDNVLYIWNETHEFIEFVGSSLKSLLKTIIKPKSVRWKDFPALFNTIGVNALPINVLIILLLGFITGWQGALQLKLFGADNFLATLVGFSIIRELSPIMVAIIVSGRSGSAFTAEIGTMKVSEELDSLSTMGFDKYSFLVVPRIISLMIALPILVAICDFVGVIGGLIAGLTTLNITIVSYFSELNNSLSMIDVSYGLIKAVFFGLAIAIIGCFRGFKVTNSAESVGKNTTSSVVTSIFVVILIDALFVVLDNSLF